MAHQGFVEPFNQLTLAIRGRFFERGIRIKSHASALGQIAQRFGELSTVTVIPCPQVKHMPPDKIKDVAMFPFGVPEIKSGIGDNDKAVMLHADKAGAGFTERKAFPNNRFDRVVGTDRFEINWKVNYAAAR